MLSLSPYHVSIQQEGSCLQIKRISPGTILSGTLILNFPAGTSLVAQWLRIHPPMQGTRV